MLDRVADEINVWSGPAFSKDGTKVIATLRATSPGNRCRGEIVLILEIADNEFVKIKSVAGSVEGWIPRDFLGDKINLLK